MKFHRKFYDNILKEFRHVIPGGAGDAMEPQDFGRLVNPISIKVGRLCPPNNIGTPGFSDLPKALELISSNARRPKDLNPRSKKQESI